MALQAIWWTTSLHVWSDDDAPADGEASSSRLRERLGEISADALIAPAAVESALSLWLPDPGTGSLQPRRVTTLALSPAQAIDFLLSLQDPLPTGSGDSVRYWLALARYVMDRLARQQFAPDVEMVSPEQFRATWRIVAATEPAMQRLDQFAMAMPPVCRAVVANGDAEPSAEPLDLVHSFLHVTADAVIRRAVSYDPFFARPQALMTEPDAGADVRWMAALLAPDHAHVSGDEWENKHLYDQARLWLSRLDQQRPDAPWKLWFMLREPEIEEQDGEVESVSSEAQWTVEFQLQSPADEEKFVEAAELWADRASNVGIFGRGIVHRRTQLISELARAAEVFPPLERVANVANPSEVKLSTLEAHLLMRQWAPQLRDKDFGVWLPNWSLQADRQLGLLLNVNPADLLGGAGGGRGGRERVDDNPDGAIVTGNLGLETLLDFDWRVAVGELKMSPEEFRQIAQLKSPLVRYRGQWMEIDTEAAHRAAEFLEQQESGKMTLAQAFRTAFGMNKSQSGLPVLGLSGSSWIEQFLEQSPVTKLENMQQPRDFAGTLRPYQLRGLDWLAFLQRLGIGACLADDMGLGKTIQLIALLLRERENGQKIGPTLLFAPTSVVGNWLKELERFAGKLRLMVHHGPERLRGDAFTKEAAERDVVVTSYSLAHRDLEDLRKVAWHRVALDEAQKIKNPSAAATLAIRSLGAPYRVALTGTPIENHLSELWSIMEILNPGLLGSAGEFHENFSVPIEKLGDADRAQHLRTLIKPFVLRRTKTDPQIAGDLPEKMEMRVYCNLTPEQAALYESITNEMLEQVDGVAGIRRRGLIFAALTRLKQICDHPALITKDTAVLDGRSGKCERLVEMLEEVIEEGDAALIFTQFREMGHLLEQVITQRLRQPVQFLHGGTPAKGRDAMIERFQKPDSDVKLFLLSLRAGGLGLNLTAANHVFHFDRWWNPAVESQATDRAHRIGQTRKVQVHKFVCVGTVEERIDKLLTDKVALADKIVSSGDEWLTNLSTEDLRNYLKLSRDAVGDYQ